jgi:predicted acetyltransferase
MIWVRPLDVPAVVAARGYPTEGHVVLEVTPAEVQPPGGDPAAGCFVLDAGPDGASCRRARRGEDCDVLLGVAELGSILLGGVAPTTLAAVGRIEERRRGALAMMDRLFASPSAPFTGTGF